MAQGMSGKAWSGAERDMHGLGGGPQGTPDAQITAFLVTLPSKSEGNFGLRETGRVHQAQVGTDMESRHRFEKSF